MPRGASGRIVVEIEPALKRQLHAVLALEGKTLKDWFIQQASEHVDRQSALAARPDRRPGAGLALSRRRR